MKSAQLSRLLAQLTAQAHYTELPAQLSAAQLSSMSNSLWNLLQFVVLNYLFK